ncbi:MAG TPA: hypothetical protein VIY48_12090 [Candidatus Paceibacterota bacterium]
MKLPAYGRDLVNLQRSGRNVEWLVISLSFDLGKALPRVVVTGDTDISELDLRCVDGLDCVVAHEGEEKRAIDVAERAIRSGASRCCTHDQTRHNTLTTDEIKAIRGIL